MIGGTSLELPKRSVHIWALQIGSSDEVADVFDPILVPDEKERAGRFRFDHLRRSFVITRGVLRCLLGSYLALHPSAIRLQYGPKGKPVVAPDAPVDFNLSHSGEMAVFAFTAGCPIGVDLERVRVLDELQAIASRFFCPEETAEIISLPQDQRERAFFNCWTRKEAYVKAVGDGLSVPLDLFRVTVKPGEPAQFVHVHHDINAANRWMLHDLSLGPQYAAALAYREPERAVLVFPPVDPQQFIAAL